MPTINVNVLMVLVRSEVKDAVTPFGKPKAANETFWTKPFFGTIVILLVPLLPRVIVKVFGVAVRAKFPSGFTVRVIVVVAFRLPEVPVMVTVAVPTFAVALAVNVTTLDDVAGFALNRAVTPLGNPLAVSKTFPENPFAGTILTVLVALPTPCMIVRVAGTAERVKLGFP